jgi:5-methylcytosine-specific restriction endonuclease McrA
LDTHHKDRDRSNNTIENIMVLCASCHAKLHYVEDDRGLQGWNAAKAQELKDRTRYDVGVQE